MTPSWGASLAFLPVIVYNFMGFELMSGAGAGKKKPARAVPLTIAVSGILIAAFYLFATIGILIALPLDEINLVSGIVDTLRVLLGEGGAGGTFVILLGLMALYSFLANKIG